MTGKISDDGDTPVTDSMKFAAEDGGSQAGPTGGSIWTYVFGKVASYLTLKAAVVPPQGRGTLQSGVPVMTSSQSAKTTVYYTPSRGNTIPIYDGTNLVPTTFTELSIATTDTAKNPAAIGASKMNDWFVWNDSGTLRLSHGPDWTNDTTRSAGTALVMVKGILLNNASITNGPAASRGTYVFTTRSNSSSQIDYILGGAASGGTAAFLGLWNAYNRVATPVVVTDNGSSYTYASLTIRQARASAGNQISFVLGLQEDGVQAAYNQRMNTPATAGATGAIGIGQDSTSTFAMQRALLFAPTAAVSAGTQSQGGTFIVGIGLHVLSANEQSDGSASITFNGDSAGSISATIFN